MDEDEEYEPIEMPEPYEEDDDEDFQDGHY